MSVQNKINKTHLISNFVSFDINFLKNALEFDHGVTHRIE